MTTLSLLQMLDHRIREATTPHEQVNALNAWAWSGWCTDPQRALRYAETARNQSYVLLAEGTPYWAGIAESLINVAHIYIRTHRYDDVKSLIEDAALIYGDLADVRGQLYCTYVRALYQFSQNRLEVAYRRLQGSITEENRATDADLIGLMQALVGHIFCRLGDCETAFSFFEQARTTLHSDEHRLLLGQTMALEALAHLQHNSLAQAIEIATNALLVQREQGDWYSQYQTLNVLIRVQLQQGNLAEARRSLESHAMIAEQIAGLIEDHRKLLLQAEVEYYNGNLDQADAYMSSAALNISRLKNPQDIIELREIAARIYQAKENYEWALMHTQEIARLQQTLLTDAMRKRASNLALPSVSAMVRSEIHQQSEQRDYLQHRVEELMRVLQMYNEVSSNLNADYVAALSLDAALRLSGGQVGFIAVLHNEVWKIRQMVGRFDGMEISLTDVLHQQLKNRRTLLMAGDRAIIEGFPYNDAIKARLLVPLHISDRLVGLLNVETSQPVRFTYSVQQLMDTLKGFVAIALENALLYERLAQQNEELQHSLQTVTRLEQLKTDMIRLVSHDLKNPLTVMKLYVGMMRTSTHDSLSPIQRRHLEAMDSSVHTMTRLITDILSLERIEAMALNPPSERFDLIGLVDETMSDLKMQADEKHHTLTFATDLPSALVAGDRTQICEAMANFISNAIKYTRENGTIQVRLYPEDAHVIFEVEDNGIGIHVNEHANIFAPSYRILNEHTNGISGTGWGLYLVKKIVTHHRGTIVFHSVYQVGSTFGFRLPLILE